MDVNFKICGSIGSEIMNTCFVVVMCLESQPRWRRLQTINCSYLGHQINLGFGCCWYLKLALYQVTAKINNNNYDSMKQTNQIEEGILLARILSGANLKLRELVLKRCAK